MNITSFKFRESSEALKSTQLTVIEQTECVLKFPELMNSQICTFQTGTSDCEVHPYKFDASNKTSSF